MFNSVAVLALVSSLLPAALSDEGVTWHTNYQKARTASMEAKKPLAVVVGNGLGGYHKVVKEGKLGEESIKMLRENYVCLYVDASTPEGQQLAKEFALPSGGIVLSDKTCNLQAFYHAGTLPEATLVTTLKRCADPNRVIQTTETLSNPRTSMYPNMDGATSGQYTSYPAYPAMQQGYYNPSFAPYGAPMMNYGSCPNCRR